MTILENEPEVATEPKAEHAAEQEIRPTSNTQAAQSTRKEITRDIILEAIGITAAECIAFSKVAKRLGVNKSTLWERIHNNPEFDELYARAKINQTDIMAEEIIEISDDTANDTLPDGRVNHENINRSKLRVDSRKWIASKLKPKKYGEKLELQGSISHTIERPPDLRTLTAQDLKALSDIQARAAGTLPAPGHEDPEQGNIERDKAQEVKPLSVREISTRGENNEIWLI